MNWKDLSAGSRRRQSPAPAGGGRCRPHIERGGSFMAVFENLKTHFHLTWWSEEVAAGGMGAGAAASEETPSSLRLLKAARGADIVLALISTSQGIDQAMDDSGTSAVALLRAQEMSAVVRALDGLAELPTKQAGDFRNGPSSS